MSGRAELPSGLVTFVFTDIEGSTRLARLLGDDYGTVLSSHRTVLRAALRDFGGVELFTEGDSFFIVFREPESALLASVEAQRRLSAHDWPSAETRPRVRIGMHTGHARPVGNGYASHEVHRAARVAAAAHGGQILCSGATARAARKSARELVGAGRTPSHAEWDLTDLGEYRLRGFDDHEQLFQVVADGLDRDFPAPRTPAAARHNLPAQLTSFIGRRAESAELRNLLAGHRLVTVAGPGGAGKTRLSLAVAEQLLPAYGDGVWTIEAGGGTSALAAALGVRSEPGRPLLESVLDHCADRRMLLVLQTCEAAPSVTAALVRRLLTACPGLNVLATSRSPLGVHGEVVWRIPALPPADVFALLAERTAAARGGQPGPGEDTADLAGVAARLEGSPLAVELAAARLRLLSAAQLADRLDDPLTALDPPSRHEDPTDHDDDPARHGNQSRHEDLAGYEGQAQRDDLTRQEDEGRRGDSTRQGDQSRRNDQSRHEDLAGYEDQARREDLTRQDDQPSRHDAAARHDSLAASLDWSYRTLTPHGAGLLRRLSVFAGPVELSTVEWCGSGALGALSELADKSLIEVVPGPRYRMSEQVRTYAARRLAAAGDEREARNRHLAWSLHTLESVAVDGDGQPRTVSLTELSPYVTEWQDALRWAAVGGSAPAGLRLAGALDPWWREHGGARDGRELLQRLYRRLDGTENPAELAGAYLVHAGLADDREERTRFLERAGRIAQVGDHPDLLVRAIAGYRVTLLEAGRYDEAEQLCREVILLAERTGVPDAALPAVLALAELLWRRDSLDQAADLLAGARQLEAGCPEDRGRRSVDWLLGMVALRRRDLIAAHDHLAVALRSRLRHGFRGGAADAVAAIAVRCALGGDPATAAVLFGGAEAAGGARRTEMFGRFWSAEQVSLRTSLGDAAFDAAYADGMDLGFDRIVALALAVEHPDMADGAARFAQTLR